MIRFAETHRTPRYVVHGITPYAIKLGVAQQSGTKCEREIELATFEVIPCIQKTPTHYMLD